MSTYTITQHQDALVVTGDGEPLDLWNELRRAYARRRRVARGPGGIFYPETTLDDVRAVVTIFDREIARFDRDVTGLAAEVRAWRRATRRIAELAAGREPAETFPDNAGFWLGDLKRLAVYLTVARYLPTRAEMLDDLARLTRHAPGSGPEGAP